MTLPAKDSPAMSRWDAVTRHSAEVYALLQDLRGPLAQFTAFPGRKGTLAYRLSERVRLVLEAIDAEVSQ